ncbi:MAG: tyrosine-protein phosphatase [Sedimentisphaerales bacterium]
MKKALILLALLLALGQSSCTTLTTNFHVVEEGRFYRSAQLDTNTLEKKIKEYNIKTVVNLRGERPTEGWYEAEKKLCKQLGVKYVSIRFSSKPSKQRIEELLFVFDGAPYPIYVHCEGGRDRTGLASVIYLVDRGKPVDEAFSHLTGWQYRNVLFTDRNIQRDFFKLYTDFCQNNGEISFRDWLSKHYQGSGAPQTQKMAFGEPLPSCP